jgi:hypothetical protein
VTRKRLLLIHLDVFGSAWRPSHHRSKKLHLIAFSEDAGERAYGGYTLKGLTKVLNSIGGGSGYLSHARERPRFESILELVLGPPHNHTVTW